jgi:hypothetical protein
MNIMAKITTLTILAAAACAAGEAQRKVTVCMLEEIGLGTERTQVAQARGIASEMFAPVGVKLDWRCPKSGPQGTIVISLATGSENLKPGELAYALPYEGTHIVIFYNRVRKIGPSRIAGVLAHVIVHEIAHILQGFPRHSATGIMKARWDANDFSYMDWKTLRFTDDDIDLIQRGLDAREARSAGATLMVSNHVQ